MTRKYNSAALRSLHSAAKDMHSVGAISGDTMTYFDGMCITAGDLIKAADVLKEDNHSLRQRIAELENKIKSL